MQKENELTYSTSVKKYKFYDFIMAAFVTILLCSNIIGAEKVVSLFGFTFGAGILFFPISYFFNDILTEVMVMPVPVRSFGRDLLLWGLPL